MIPARTVSSLLLLGALMGCGDRVQPAVARFGNDVVAEAYGEVLTWDSLAQQVPDDLNLEDSAAFAERVLDRWLREQVLVNEARTQLRDELASIEQALEVYRRSLLINTYENRYVASRLDEEVSEEDIVAYYDAHPELFTLHDHAVQVLYCTCPIRKSRPKPAAPIGRVARPALGTTTWIKSEWLSAADSASIPELERWCMERVPYHVDHEAWWLVRDLVDEVPLSLYRVEDQIQRTPPLVQGKRPHLLRALPGPRSEGKDRATRCGPRPNHRAPASKAPSTAARSPTRHPASARLGGGGFASRKFVSSCPPSPCV